MAKEKKAEEAKPKNEDKVSEVNLETMVDGGKIKRAQQAITGLAKAGSSEAALFVRLKGKYEGDALLLEIYKGLGGLVDLARAKQNRENEAKAAKKRASL